MSELPSDLRELHQWLSASAAEAEALLPELRHLPAAALRRELRTRPELRTPGVMRRLLDVARDSRGFDRVRAHQLTLMVVRYAGAIRVPPAFAPVVRTLKGEAWREHALALRDLGKIEKAERAIAAARACFAEAPAGDWHMAIVDLIEAPLLDGRGRHQDALKLIRRAARRFADARDHVRHVQARMTEASMLWSSGDFAAAASIWNATFKAAQRRGDKALMGQVAAKIGVVELGCGSAEEAWRLLKGALDLFDKAGVAAAEAVRARWNFAEAAAALGRIHEAVSEYHKVRSQLLAHGSRHDAAIAATDVVELLLLAEREHELPWLTTTFVHTFRDAGMAPNGIEAFAWLRGRAAAECLTPEDVVVVRRYFEDLAHQPNARFRVP